MATTLRPNSRADRIGRIQETSGASGVGNVGQAERIVSGVGGLALLAHGLKHGGWGGAAVALLGGALLYRGATGYCGLYDALSIAPVGKQRRTGGSVHRGLKVTRIMTVNRPRADCYRFWHDFENLPTFMRHLEKVELLNGARSLWVARSPFGTVAWEADLIADTPDELIAWRSVEGADIDNAGSVRFRDAPGGRGTEVTVALNYEPPAGRIGVAIARLFGEEPETQVRDDLGRFKQIMEAGAVPAAEGQASSRSS